MKKSKNKHSKEPLSITKLYTIKYTLNGILWLLYSTFALLPTIPFKLFAAVFLFGACICTFLTIVLKQEPDDEMSNKHIWIAKSESLDKIFYIIMLIGIISFYVPIPFNKIYGFFVAASQLLPGLMFMKYEKEGL